MPTFYKPPLGLPFYWGHEVSGVLAGAVETYLENRLHGKSISDGEIALLREYLTHYINAPCWDESGFAEELANLRTSTENLKSADDIAAWNWKAMDIGLDPF